MSSEAHQYNHEIEADPTFLLTLGAVQTRFEQVADIHRASDYPHMLIDGHPDVQDPLGVFVLVEGYDRLLHGSAEVLKIGVPLVEPDPEHPEGQLWVKGYFVLTWYEQEREQSHIVDADTFLSLFPQTGTDDLPVASLAEKILTFKLVPVAVDP